MHWLASLIARFKRRRPAPLPAATFDETGITQGAIHISWSSVANVMAYKEDRYITDLLCVAFFSTEATRILCTELNHSFVDIAASIRAYLPASLQEWHLILMTTPAFELSLTRSTRSPKPLRNRTPHRQARRPANPCTQPTSNAPPATNG